MTEEQKQKYCEYMGLIKTKGLVLDFPNRKMTILNNEATEESAIDATKEKVFELMRKNKDFSWRELISEVEIMPDTTILNNAILADSIIARLVIPASVTTSLGYAICYTKVGEIVFEGENLSFSKAEGMFEGIEGIQDGIPPKITCKNKTLLNSLLVNKETMLIPDEMLINGKTLANYNEKEIQEAREQYVEMPFEGNEFKYTINKYYSSEDIKIETENFSLDTLTGILVVKNNNLTENEIIYVSQKTGINPKTATTCIKFAPNVTRCPGTAFAEYKKITGIYFPKNVVGAGVNSFASAGDGSESFWVAFENPNFNFITAPRAFNSAGISTEDDSITTVTLFIDAELDDDTLNYIAPRENTNIEVKPFNNFFEMSEASLHAEKGAKQI